jgi:hypothetical protein
MDLDEKQKNEIRRYVEALSRDLKMSLYGIDIILEPGVYVCMCMYICMYVCVYRYVEALSRDLHRHNIRARCVCMCMYVYMYVSCV